MSQPPTHTTSTPARTASASSGDKRGKRPPHHHTLSLLGSASEMLRAFLPETTRPVGAFQTVGKSLVRFRNLS